MKKQTIFSIFPLCLSILKNGCSFALRKGHPEVSTKNFLYPPASAMLKHCGQARKPGFFALRIFSSWTKHAEKRNSVREEESINDFSVCLSGEKGYVAVMTVLVVGIVLITVGLSATIMSINETQQALGEKNKEVSLGVIESCVDDALLKLNTTNNIPATVTLPTGSCSVTINSQVGNSWTFTVSGTTGGHTKNVQVTATRGTTVTVTSWLEI